MTLTKNYWVLFEGNKIKNSDYLEKQTGVCNVGVGTDAAEFDTLEELEAFVYERGLIYDSEIC